MTISTPTHHGLPAAAAAAAAVAITIGGVAAGGAALSTTYDAGTRSPASVPAVVVESASGVVHPGYRHFHPTYRHFHPTYRHFHV